MKIKITGLERNHVDAGPGVRTEVFTYGCSKNCPGCQNKWTEELPAISIGTFKLARDVAKHSKGLIAISGGEPLEQPAALLSFIKWVRRWDKIRYFRKTNILLFTGLTSSEMIASAAKSCDNNINSILDRIDYLVTGPWDERQPYKRAVDTCVGSKNQFAFIVTKDSIEAAKLDAYGRFAIQK